MAVEGGTECPTLVTVTRDGVGPFDLTIGEGDRAWDTRPMLLEDVASQPLDPCGERGKASLPALSSRGDLAFMGTPSLVGMGDGSRADAPFTLFLRRANESASATLAKDYRYPTDLAWDRAGNRLAIAYANGAQVVDVASGSVVTVADHAEHVAWSPDGTQLAISASDDAGTMIRVLPAP